MKTAIKRATHRDDWRTALREEEWLLIEWPHGETEPVKYVLSTLPPDTFLKEWVSMIMLRWRIERNYQELKQEFGLAITKGEDDAASIITLRCASPPTASSF